MSESMWGVLFVIMGLIGIFFISLFENTTTTNDQNYYLLKETTEAAMWDSLDLGYFRSEGIVKIDKQKFVESFTRRFAESTNLQKTYDISFYEIIEEPPKVTIEVAASSQVIFDADDFKIINILDAVLESEWDGSITNPPSIGECTVTFIPGYLEETSTGEYYQAQVDSVSCNCRTVKAESPYILKRCQLCEKARDRTIQKVFCCSCGSTSEPGCPTGWREKGRDYGVACNTDYTRCDTCPVYETRWRPIVESQYIEPQYILDC